MAMINTNSTNSGTTNTNQCQNNTVADSISKWFLQAKAARFTLCILFFSLGNVFVWHQMIVIDEEQVERGGDSMNYNDKGGKNNYNIIHSKWSMARKNGLLIDKSFMASAESPGSNQMKNANNTTSTNTKKDKDNGWKNHAIPEDGVAGCLLLKDDNDRLAEWLAYHWLTLPLKYLLVAIDPTGTTSPRHILEKWGAQNDNKSSNSTTASTSTMNMNMNLTTMGIEIEIWDDVDYDHWINEELDEKHKHRDRQKRFLADCELYHKEKGRSWLAVIDPDEYITFNLINDDDPVMNDNSAIDEDVPEKFLSKKYVNEMYSVRRGFGSVKNYLNSGHYQEQQTVFSFIQKNQHKEPWISEPCYLMPRLFFSAVESSPNVLSKSNVEQYGLNPLQFSTLRYFHHARRGGFEYNHYGKVLVDLRRILRKEIERDMYSIHRPNYKSCLRPVKPYFDGVLRVHHYLGSWTQYSARSDVRRSRERFDKFGSVDYGTDYQLQSWLHAFVEVVGVEKAKWLLENSGIVEKNSVRIIDTQDFIHVQRRIENEAGDKEMLTYFYDEDGSIVDIQNSEGISVPFSERDLLNSIV